MNKLIAIDGNSLMYRAFFALPGMTAKNGTPTGALYGFFNMLFKMTEYSPTHIAVAFDMHAPTFRHKHYDGYKAGRPETPQDLITQFDIVKKLLSKMNITVLECEGFEADDILGTLSLQAENLGYDVLLVTGDRDALQLVSEHTHVIMNKKGMSDIIEYDISTLSEQYGLSPARMVDLKGLMGDSSDNLPGIKGVGEKTALKLLEKYGTLEEVLTRGALEEKGALQTKIVTYKDDARLSYYLGTIVRNAPISVTADKCTFSVNDMQNILPDLLQLQLRNIAKQVESLTGTTATSVQKNTFSDVKTIAIKSIEELNDVVNEAKKHDIVAVDISKEVTISFDNNTEYKAVTFGTLLDMGLDIDEVYKTILPLFSCDTKIVTFDAKTLLHTLCKYGINFDSIVFDEMIGDYLLSAVRPCTTLAELAADRCAGTPGACAIFRLYPIMKNELEQKNLLSLYNEVEHPLIEVLFDMEKCGFAVDCEILKALSMQFDEKRKALENEIFEMAGEEFNIQSPKQLSQILFHKLMLPPPKQKNKTDYSTSADVLENYRMDYPIVDLVLEYRFAAKLKSTFIDGLLEKMDKQTGRIYSTFNQNVTSTGRISSTEPNLQNIPTRTDEGKEIRRAFIAEEGHLLVDADYSQIELRVLSSMSGDRTMIDAFNSGTDIHTKTASEVFGTPISLVTHEQRSAAKAVNFGIVYGISDFGLAKQLGISRKRAGEYIKMYLDRYPLVDKFMKDCIEQGREKGYAVTLSGRRRELTEIKSSNYNTRSFGERIAMNMPVQGTAADIIKIAMVKVYKALKEHGYKAKLILQVHDELIVDTPENEAEDVKHLLCECMESAFELAVPLCVEANIGKSWYDTK